MDLSIVTVSWNVRDRLRECLRSIFDTTRGCPLSFDVFVVDNASRDGSAEMVAREFPNVRLIANAENLGFARANNQILKRRTPKESKLPTGQAPNAEHKTEESEFFLLLNPDTRVLPGTLDGIVGFMREPRNARVGIAGCHLVNERGETVPHVRRFPTLSDQLITVLKLTHLRRARHIRPTAVDRICHALTAPIDRYLITNFDYSREARVDSIRGSCFCIRRKLIEQIGLLDERFFLWFEEVDFCMRARQAGWQVAYTPTVTCVDSVGQSFAQVQLSPKQRMFSESMLTYFRKHRPRWEWVVLVTIRPLVLGLAWVHDAVVQCVQRGGVSTLRGAVTTERAWFEPKARARWRNASEDSSQGNLNVPARVAPRPQLHAPQLTVQLVTWNGARYIPYLFQSLRAQTLCDWELSVIDNASTDGTAEALERELATFDRPHRFIRNAANCGFAGGHNQAFAMSDSDFVQLLNQDIVLAPEYLERVLAAMGAMPDTGAAQGALLRWDFSKVEAPDGGRTDTIDTLGLRILRNRRVVDAHAGERLTSHVSGLRPPIEVFGISGALPMYRTAALRFVALRKSEVSSQKLEVSEFGIFDEDFFSYKEDVDLAFRLRAAGWRSFIVPGTCAWHDRTAVGSRERSDRAALDNRRTQPAFVRYHSYKNHLFVLAGNERLVNFARDWPWICWYEFKKFAYLLCCDRATLRALREAWRLRRAMRRKRAQVMAKWLVTPAEMRKWFR